MLDLSKLEKIAPKSAPKSAPKIITTAIDDRVLSKFLPSFVATTGDNTGVVSSVLRPVVIDEGQIKMYLSHVRASTSPHGKAIADHLASVEKALESDDYSAAALYTAVGNMLEIPTKTGSFAVYSRPTANGLHGKNPLALAAKSADLGDNIAVVIRSDIGVAVRVLGSSTKDLRNSSYLHYFLYSVLVSATEQVLTGERKSDISRVQDDQLVLSLESTIVRLSKQGLGSQLANGTYRRVVAQTPDQRKKSYLRGLSMAHRLSNPDLTGEYLKRLTQEFETVSSHYQRIVARFEKWEKSKLATATADYIGLLESKGKAVPDMGELEAIIRQELWTKACLYDPNNRVEPRIVI